ncbi:SprT family zinc-dependent metalloprotease [Deinococcus sp. RIT780]|uniref:M48 family metallopeptidase n=1 Tax=Deinococcus sp. RIT780 TaxID=2870472 RepID=UPI001C8AAB79|nr:M48 family metallopeptidase [Deinococcus sp. RIT780]
MSGATNPNGWQVAGIPVLVKRSDRRRTVALQVKPGEVTLYAPARVPDTKLLEILNARRDWVAGHLAQYALMVPPAPPSLTGGQPLPFLGDTLTLRLSEDVARPERHGDTLHLPAAHADAALEAWTRHAAHEPYRALVAGYATQLGAQHRLRRVLVAGAKGRWGSCTAGGDIRLHWRLTRAPLPVLHYVALHEAAHLLELNHSPRYWAHVARVMPGWQAHRAWLRTHGHTL